MIDTWVIPCQMKHWVSGDPSDFAHIHTICSSIGRMNTQKNQLQTPYDFENIAAQRFAQTPLFGFCTSRH